MGNCSNTHEKEGKNDIKDNKLTVSQSREKIERYENMYNIPAKGFEKLPILPILPILYNIVDQMSVIYARSTCPSCPSLKIRSC